MDQHSPVDGLEMRLVERHVVLLPEAAEVRLERDGDGDAHVVAAVVHPLQQVLRQQLSLINVGEGKRHASLCGV